MAKMPVVAGVDGSEESLRAREVASGLLIDVDLLTGPPALAVTQSGSVALMLVVGARGSGGFAAMMLGSVSRYAAMQAGRCPLLELVPLRAQRSRGRSGRGPHRGRSRGERV